MAWMWFVGGILLWCEVHFGVSCCCPSSAISRTGNFMFALNIGLLRETLPPPTSFSPSLHSPLHCHASVACDLQTMRQKEEQHERERQLKEQSEARLVRLQAEAAAKEMAAKDKEEQLRAIAEQERRRLEADLARSEQERQATEERLRLEAEQLAQAARKASAEAEARARALEEEQLKASREAEAERKLLAEEVGCGWCNGWDRVDTTDRVVGEGAETAAR